MVAVKNGKDGGKPGVVPQRRGGAETRRGFLVHHRGHRDHRGDEPVLEDVAFVAAWREEIGKGGRKRVPREEPTLINAISPSSSFAVSSVCSCVLGESIEVRNEFRAPEGASRCGMNSALRRGH